MGIKKTEIMDLAFDIAKSCIGTVDKEQVSARVHERYGEMLYEMPQDEAEKVVEEAYTAASSYVAALAKGLDQARQVVPLLAVFA
jgi:hypothetical protein